VRTCFHISSCAYSHLLGSMISCSIELPSNHLKCFFISAFDFFPFVILFKVFVTKFTCMMPSTWTFYVHNLFNADAKIPNDKMLCVTLSSFQFSSRGPSSVPPPSQGVASCPISFYLSLFWLFIYHDTIQPSPIPSRNPHATHPIVPLICAECCSPYPSAL
jgi:hypothetical protein